MIKLPDQMIGFNWVNQIGLTGLLLASLLISGCARLSQSPVPEETAATTEPDTGSVEVAQLPSAGKEDLTPSLLYGILLGEIAGQRGRMEVSAPSYLEAAQHSEDPRVAERALKISIFGKQQAPALEAARRWVELAPDNKEARQAYAALALRSGQDEEAQTQLNQIIQQSDGTADQAYQSLLGLLAREPDKERALAAMERIVSERPDDADAHFAYARLASHSENWVLSLTEVEKALVIRPDWTPAIILRAQIAVKQDKGDLAREQITGALQKSPDDLKLRQAYARLLVDLEDLDGAREQYKKLIKLQPANGQVVYSLALLSLEDGELKEAKTNFLRLLELEYQTAQAHYYLGAIAEEHKDFEKALDWYSKIDKGDHWLEVQIRIARIDAKTDKLDQARARLKNLRFTKPAQAQRLLLVEGDLLSQQKMLEEAYSLYGQYLEAHPEDYDVLYARSLVAEKLDLLDVAEQDLKKIIQVEPDNARAMNALGYTLADRTTRYQEALQFIEQAIKLTPDDPAVMDSMGWVQFKLGELQKAREYLQKAYDQTTDAEIAAHLGEVLWSMGDQAGARKLWAAGKKKDSENPVLLKTLERFSN
ncbi:MAG: tetratricopeptide repeat protein [Gammaproteobacteria bacterium]